MRPDLDTDVVRLDVALYFQQNPVARETAYSVSRRIGRPTELVARVLERLAEQAVLVRRGSGAQAFYRYQRPYLGALTEEGA